MLTEHLRQDAMAGASTERAGSSWWGRLPLSVPLLILVLLVVCSITFLPVQVYADGLWRTPGAQAPEEGEGEDPDATGQGYLVFDTQDLIDAQTNHSSHAEGVIISNEQVPLSSSPSANQNPGTNGSLFNTVLAGVCILSMVVMLVLLLVYKTSDYRVIVVRTLAVAFGLVTVVIWSLFDRLQAPTVFLNDFSPLIGVVFGIYVIMAFASYLYEAKLNKEGMEH